MAEQFRAELERARRASEDFHDGIAFGLVFGLGVGFISGVLIVRHVWGG